MLKVMGFPESIVTSRAGGGAGRAFEKRERPPLGTLSLKVSMIGVGSLRVRGGS